MVDIQMYIEEVKDNFNFELSTYDDFCDISKDFEKSLMISDIFENEN